MEKLKLNLYHKEVLLKNVELGVLGLPDFILQQG